MPQTEACWSTEVRGCKRYTVTCKTDSHTDSASVANTHQGIGSFVFPFKIKWDIYGPQTLQHHTFFEFGQGLTTSTETAKHFVTRVERNARRLSSGLPSCVLFHRSLFISGVSSLPFYFYWSIMSHSMNNARCFRIYSLYDTQGVINICNGLFVAQHHFVEWSFGIVSLSTQVNIVASLTLETVLIWLVFGKVLAGLNTI